MKERNAGRGEAFTVREGRVSASGGARGRNKETHTVLGPLVLLLDLRLLLGREVVDNVEAAREEARSARASIMMRAEDAQLADLLGLLALDHVGDRLAPDVTACAGKESASGCRQPEDARQAKGGKGRSSVQEGLDVEVVGGEDDLKEHLLVDLDDCGVA